MRITILGGGPGGYSAAFEAARLGAQVTLVESDRLGGTCLNRGCIPTKTILRSAHIMRDSSRAAEFGLTAGAMTLDVDALRLRKEGVVDTLVGQVESEARRLKVEVVSGLGRLVSATVVAVTDADGNSTSIESDAVILATGSEVVRLPFIDHDLEGVWTSDEACSVDEIPEEAIVLGGGVIGLEFACAWATFGSKVTVVEMAPQVLPGNDARVARTVKAELEKAGVVFRLTESVTAVEQVGGRIRASLSGGDTLEADVLLSAVGRRPRSQGFGFEEVGLEFDRAALAVDGFYRTNVEGVFAIGDLIGGWMLAHVAEDEGVAAARNAVAQLRGENLEATVRYDCVPACVYTFPEVAVVGSTREGAKERGVDSVASVAKFTGNGKALAEGETEGFVQMVAEKGSGRVIGCQIVGPHAVEIIHEVAFAIRTGMTVEDVAHATHAHPTVSEAVKAAAHALTAKV